MQHITASSLEDLPSRIAYLSSFLNLTEADGDALRASKPLVAPLIPTILDAVYAKLLSYDITAAVFVPKNTGYEGDIVADVKDLTLESPQIKYRKDFLKNYLVKLVSVTDISPTSSFWVYLNNVGIMHTGLPGFKHRAKKPELRVEYIHMGALLGYVVDLVIGAVMEMEGVQNETKSDVLRAFNKVLWVQNDLFARHYLPGAGVGKGVDGAEEVTPPRSPGEEVGSVGDGNGGGCPFSG